MGKRAIGSCLPFFDEFIPKVIEFLEQRGYKWKIFEYESRSPSYEQTWMKYTRVSIEFEQCFISTKRTEVLYNPATTTEMYALREIFQGWSSPDILKRIHVEVSLVSDILKIASDISHSIERISPMEVATSTMHRQIFNLKENSCEHQMYYVNDDMRLLLSI